MPQVAKLLSLGLIIVGGCMALFTPQGRAMFDNPWEVNIGGHFQFIILNPFIIRAHRLILGKLLSLSTLEYSVMRDGTISIS